MPAVYERCLAAPVFRPFAVDLSRRVATQAPKRVLELAAGTGVLTRELVASTGAEVTATDLSDAMVEFGAARSPGAAWRQADALALPFEDAEFDVVACQFGVMFFPDKVAGFAEARRVLTSNGTFVFNTWGPLEAHDFQAAASAAVARALPEGPPDFLAKVPHAYWERDLVATDLATAGFDLVGFEVLELEGEAPSAAELATGYCSGTPLRAAIEARGDLDAITSTVANEMQARLGAGAVTGRMTAHVFEARPASN